MEIKKYVKLSNGEIYNTIEGKETELNGALFTDKKSFTVIYENNIIASNDDIGKLFDYFICNREIYPSFSWANNVQKRHKGKDIFGATFNKEGNSIICRAKYLGNGEWELL